MKTLALFAIIALCANPAHAGFFQRLFGRGCSSCAPCKAAAKPTLAPPAKQYRYECKNGVCRRVEVK